MPAGVCSVTKQELLSLTKDFFFPSLASFLDARSGAILWVFAWFRGPLFCAMMLWTWPGWTGRREEWTVGEVFLEIILRAGSEAKTGYRGPGRKGGLHKGEGLDADLTEAAECE